MQKESVKAFKNELRNYRYYCARIKDLTEKIEFFYDRLGGVRAIDPSKEPMHSAPSKEYEYMLRDQIENYDRKKTLYKMKKDYIDGILGNVETSLRDALKRVYIDGTKVEKVAAEHFLSSSGMAKRMDRAIEKALE